MRDRDGATPNERTRNRRERRRRAKIAARLVESDDDPGGRRRQLAYLFRRQRGRCFICGEAAVLDGQGGQANCPDSAVRMRTGSSFGEKGRVRPRVMTHRKCAQARSDEIQASQDVDLLRWRSGRFPVETYKAASRAAAE